MALPEPLFLIPPKTIARFWAKVDIADENECWLWNGAKSSYGYGSFGFGKKHFIASRLVWMLLRGPISEGMVVMHICDTPSCVNIAHLRIGTTKDNSDDKVSKNRHRWVYGERHYSKTNPEKLATGSRNGSRKHPERLLRGETHHSAKLTEDDVLEIRKLYAIGFTCCEIAEKFSINPTSAHKAATGRTWKHVLTP